MSDPPITEFDGAPAPEAESTAPRVSIVMPTYNSVSYLTSSVASVRAQTFSSWELVLFDDGSSDTTVLLSKELAECDHRIRLGSGAHLGTGGARNGGFRRTDPRSEFVVFLDHDDTWEPDALATLVAVLDRETDAVAVHAIARAIDMDGRPFPGDDLADSMRIRRELRGGELVDLPLAAPTSFEAMLVKNCVVTPGTSLIRRSILTSVGGYEPETSPADDWDLNIRLARRGSFAFLNQIVLNWRRHPSAQANTSKRWRHAYLLVRRRSIDARDNRPDQRRAAMALLRWDCHHARQSVATNVKGRRARSTASAAYYALLLHADLLRIFVRDRLGRRPAGG